MNTRSNRFTGLALLGLLALTQLLAPSPAHADPGLIERHEIPVFVLERTEIASGTDASARLAADRMAAEVAIQEIVR